MVNELGVPKATAQQVLQKLAGTAQHATGDRREQYSSMERKRSR
jgi:hypothetical protein